MIHKLTPLLTQNVLAYMQRATQGYENQVRNVVDRINSITNEYVVRGLREKDNHLASDFIRKILLERGGIGIDEDYYDSELSDLFGAYRRRGRKFNVLTCKGGIVGTAGITGCDDETRTCRLVKLNIDKDHRSRGNGTELLHQTLADAVVLGYSRCLLEVDGMNKKAIGFFERNGFQMSQCASFNGFEHDIVMTKTICDI